MEQNQQRTSLFVRLSLVVFFAELAHGMLLYGIVPELASARFPEGANLLSFLPGHLRTVSAVQLAGMCLAAYVLAELLFKVPSGHWVDRRGSDLPLLFGLAISFATVPVILLSHHPHWMLVGAFLHGIGAAPVWPAVISAWTRGRSARERGEIMGQILTFWMAGLGLGLILGNVLVGLSGRAELVATFSPLLLWAIALGAALWSGQRLGSPAPAGEEGEAAPRLRLSPELRLMAIGLFIQNLAFGSLILAFRELATRKLLAADNPSLSSIQFGLMVLLGGAPSVLLLGPMGKVADLVGRRNAVIYSMLVVTPLILVAPFLSYLRVDPWVRFGIMIPGLLVAAVAYALLLPAWHALALGRIPEQQRGSSLALLMSVEMVALAGGHVVGPSIYAKVHFTAPFLFAGITFGALAAVYLMGYILPQETPEEPHVIDLAVPPGSPSDANGARGEGVREEAGAASRSGHNAG